MSWCGKRALDTMLLHEFGHFSSKVGICGVTSEALDIM
jgi:hypothetical protein